MPGPPGREESDTITTLTQAAPTLDDLLARGSDARLEVVEGAIIEMTPVGGRHVLIVDNLYRMLHPIVAEHKLGFGQAEFAQVR